MSHESLTPDTPLAELCARAARGEERAFEQLHQRLSGGLRQFFAQRGCDDAALRDELVQRTWIAVWTAIREGRYDPARSAITTFAYGTALNLWLQQLRPRQGAGPLPDDDVRELGLFGTHDPATFARSCELLEAVRVCVRARNTPYELDEVEREIAEALSHGVSERQVAQQLGLAPSTINVRKRSAMQKLRMCLRAKGFSDGPSERGALELE